ncbi:hypothetical protein ABIB68_007471 [Bradyrhizobium sp. F1.2.2]
MKIKNTVRGLLKTFGLILKIGSQRRFIRIVRSAIQDKPVLLTIVEPMLIALSTLQEQIGVFDSALCRRATADPIAKRLMSAPGVGVIVALSYISTVHAGRHRYGPGDAEPARSPVAGGDATWMIRGGMRVMIRPDSRANRPAIEIADILRRHGDTYRRVHASHLGRVERRVMSAIVACRTEALGGHMEACDDCGTTRVAYNSCLMGKAGNGELAAT